MSTASTIVSPTHPATVWALRALWLLAVLLAARFVALEGLVYANLDESTYGRFWPMKAWLMGHIVGGTLALVIGPVQFLAAVRGRFLNVHRWLGRVYLLGIVLASSCATVLALTTALAIHWTWAAGLMGLAVPWLISAIMGYRAIRQRRMTQHREWMIRSYVLTFAFVIFRILDDDLFPPSSQEAFVEQAVTFGWVAWAWPLFFTEVCLQWNKR